MFPPLYAVTYLPPNLGASPSLLRLRNPRFRLSPQQHADPDNTIHKHHLPATQPLQQRHVAPHADQCRVVGPFFFFFFFALARLDVQIHGAEGVLGRRRVPGKGENVPQVLRQGVGFGDRFDKVGLCVQRVEEEEGEDKRAGGG